MQPLSAEVFARLVPILRQAGLSHITHIHELAGGLSNHNYHIQTSAAQYVLRLNADAADRFCSREQELFYWRNLAKAKLAPELIWASCDHRYYVSAFIESQEIACRVNVSRTPEMLGDGADFYHVVNWSDLEYQCSAAEFTHGELWVQRWLHAHAENLECALYETPTPQSFAAEFTPLTLLESQCPNYAHALLQQLLQQYNEALSEIELVIELGRFLVAEAGIYACKVVDKKISRGTTYLVCNGGLHHHLANSGNFGQVIRKNYPVAIGNRLSSNTTEQVTIVGPLCTPLDILADRVTLPQADVGDWVVVYQSGAYGPTASPQDFLGHPAVVEILV